MKFITFCQLSDEFLKKPLEERTGYIHQWNKIAEANRVKVLFWGMPQGVSENLVYAFETKNDGISFFQFEREWLSLGTDEAGRFVKYLRSIVVY